MTITASCGHTLADGEKTVTTIYHGEDCDSDGFHPCVFYCEYCPQCAAEARAWPEFLPSHEAAEAWLATTGRP